MDAAKPAAPVWPFSTATAAVATLLIVPSLNGAPSWLHGLSLLATGRPLAPPHAIVLGLALAFVARGAQLRRRAAWFGLILLVGMGLLAVAAGDDALWRLPLLAAALAALWLRRSAFDVRPHPDRVKSAVRTGAGLVLGTVVLSVLIGGVSPGSVGRDVATGLGSTGAPIDGASWLPGLLGLVGGVGLLVMVVTLLAADPPPAPGGEDERRRVAGLVAHPGSDTLAPFALRRDKSYVFSPDGGAAIGYRVLFGIAAAGGDPVGDPASHEAAVRAFLDLCRRTGWRPAVLGASAEMLPAWEGLHSIGFGDEVVLRPEEFSLSGRSMRNVRQAVKRTHNTGVTTEIVRESDLSPELRERLLGIASSSLGGAAERGFSMNLDELLTGFHPGTVVAVAYDGDGAPIAFQRYAVAGGALSLDAMRRSPEGPNGVNERLIVEVAEYAAEHGHRLVSLNFAAFRELLEAEDRNVAERVGYRTLHLLDPLIAVESLYLFNKKFRPGYQPRSVVFRSWSDILLLAAALLTLEFGRTRPGRAHAAAPAGAREDALPEAAHPAGHLERP
ncbi:bifunctional lysylphosphatidylglycerol flippase/synthetase MprF [Actinomadura parmotrematis]|uniref:Phosphatidylglycerol lysyltransferase domain-containing protein n=1 Tax=Actinomadura parmotrematis TaxID=2864039 RepID=A0ABS7FTF8_9ACTN|nr:phosphatidylglycerol lysyltransferase domain-containing protein [Actinomadura parmotrematis]MBW8483693.1 phosphatidylglycerol lysyltransferase domain-containing protein [Actinomadura parmotrematis]